MSRGSQYEPHLLDKLVKLKEEKELNLLIHGYLSFSGSTIIYPKYFLQPIKEDYLLSGKDLWDTDTPSGISGKLLDSEYKNLGWSHTVSLKTGLSMVCRWYFGDSRNFWVLRSLVEVYFTVI